MQQKAVDHLFKAFSDKQLGDIRRDDSIGRHINDLLKESASAIGRKHVSRSDLVAGVCRSIEAIRDINSTLKNYDESSANLVFRQLREMKPVAPFWNLMPCQISMASALNNSFDPSSEFDWHRLFVHCNSLTVEKITSTDYLTRKAIRDQNLEVMKRSTKDYLDIIEDLVNCKNLEILKCTLEYGVFPSSGIKNLVANLRENLYSSVNALLTAEDDYIDAKGQTKERQTRQTIVKKKLKQEIGQLINFEDALESGCQILNFRSSQFYKSMKLDTVLLALVQYHDTIDIVAEHSTSELSASVKSWLFDDFLDNKIPSLCNVATKDVDMRVNRLLLTLTSIEEDVIMKSHRFLMGHEGLADYHHASIEGVGDRGMAHDHAQGLGVIIEKVLGEGYRSWIYKDGASDIDDAFIKDVEAAMVDLENKFAVLTGQRHLIVRSASELASRTPIQLTPEYKYSFSISNGVYNLLWIAQALLSWTNRSQSTHPLVGVVFRMIATVCQDNCLASAHLFGDKEWGIMNTVIRVDWPSSLLWLSFIIKTNPGIFDNHLHALDLLLDLWEHDASQVISASRSESGSKSESISKDQSEDEGRGEDRDSVEDKSSSDHSMSGFNDRELLQVDPTLAKQCFAWLHLMHSALQSAVDMPTRARLSIKIQRALAFKMEFFTIFLTRHHRDYKLDVKLAENCHFPMLLLEADTTSDRVMWFNAFMFARTLNETLVCCQSFLDPEGPELISALFASKDDSHAEASPENSKRLNYELFADVETGLIYYSEMVKLYTRLFSVELGNSKESLGKFIDFGSTHDLEKYFKSAATMIVDLVESLNDFKGFRFKEEYENINKSFILESLIPLCFKFINAVFRFVEVENYQKTGVTELMNTLVDNRAIITRMVNKTDLLKKETKGMFVQSQVGVNVNEELRENTIEEERPTTMESLYEFKQSILLLYEGCSAKYKPFIDIYIRTPPPRCPTLDEKDTNRFPMFRYLEPSGSLLLTSMRKKCDEYTQRHDTRMNAELVQELQLALLPNDIKNQERNSGDTPELRQCKEEYNCQDLPHKIPNLADSIKTKIQRYMNWKEYMLTNPDSAWYRSMDEGREKDVDYYYSTLTDWIFCYTDKAMQLATVGPDLEESHFNAESKPSKSRTNTSETDEKSQQSKSKSDRMDPRWIKMGMTVSDLFIEQPQVSGWLVVLDTHLRVKGNILRHLIYRRYMDEKVLGKSESLFDKLKLVKPGEGLQEDMEKQAGHTLMKIGHKVIEGYLRSVLSLQMTMKNKVFCKMFYVNFIYFFEFSALLMSLADDNFKATKLYVGRQDMKNKSQVLYKYKREIGMDETLSSISDAESYHDAANEDDDQDKDSEKLSREEDDQQEEEKAALQIEQSLTTSGFLALYLKGLMLENSKQQPAMKISTRSPMICDSADTLIYNAVLLKTVKEFFCGPCLHNQLAYVNDIGDLLKALHKVDQEVDDIRFYYQVAIIEFLLSLLEGNSEAKINVVGQRQPSEYYNLVVFYIQYLWILRKLAVDKNLKPTLKELKNWSKYPESALQMIDNEYQKENNFAKHPAINIAIGLVHIINAVQTKKRLYKRFVSEKHSDTLALYGSQGIEIELSKFSKKEPMKGVDRKKALKEDKNKKLIFFHFVNIISCMIEVSIKGQKLCIPYQVMPKCFFLTQDSKKVFRMRCDISDPSRKLLALMDSSPIFIVEMDHYLKLYQKSPLLFWISSNDTFKRLMKVTWWIALALNITVGVDWGYKNKYGERVFDRPYTTGMIVDICNYIIIGICSIVLILWLSLMLRMAAQKTDERMINQERVNFGVNILSVDKSSTVEKNQLETKGKKRTIKRRLFPWLEQFSRELFIPSFFSLHLLFALLSFIHPIFLAMHLFTITYISATSRYVLTAIQRPIIQLTFALVLILFIIYSYSVIIAYFFSQSFLSSETQNHEFCDNVRGCLLYILDLGLRKGGGIGEAMEVYPYSSGGRFYWKTVLDLSFLLLINIIMLSIFFSIIVGAFNDLRSDLQTREEDEKNTCFICGFTRKDFEKQERPFDFHVQFEHNIWDYVNFVVYLQDNLINDYSGNEYYLKEKFKSRSTEWLPVDGTIYLSSIFLPR
jgi:hypothetical protein